MDYETIAAFILASAALAISPGPDNFYVLTQGVTFGKKYGLATSVGLVSGCLVHTTLLAFGISALIKESEMIFFIIKLFGAAYLLYLALKVYKGGSSIHLTDNENIPRKSLPQLFRQGFIMNVLNPKVTLFFLAFFPGFLFSETMDKGLQFYILGLLFMTVALIIFGLISLLAGNISNYIKGNNNAGVFLKWLQIIVFIGIGAYILISDK